MAQVNSIIRGCSCKHPPQDELNGPNMRVHNLTQKGKEIPVWRCTVCNKEVAAKPPI